MLFQPALSRFVFRAQSLHFAPEPGRMVHVPQVRQFMEDQVIPHKRRRLHQTPVQENRPPPRAGAPSRALVPDRHPPRRQLMRGGVLVHTQWQFPSCQPPKMLFYGWAQISVSPIHTDALGAKSNQAGFPVYACLNSHQFSAKEDLCPNSPGLRTHGACCQTLQLPFHPSDIPFRKPARFGSRAAARDRDPRGTIRAQPEHIPPRAPMVNQHQRNRPPADHQALTA